VTKIAAKQHNTDLQALLLNQRTRPITIIGLLSLLLLLLPLHCYSISQMTFLLVKVKFSVWLRIST